MLNELLEKLSSSKLFEVTPTLFNFWMCIKLITIGIYTLFSSTWIRKAVFLNRSLNKFFYFFLWMQGSTESHSQKTWNAQGCSSKIHHVPVAFCHAIFAQGQCHSPWPKAIQRFARHWLYRQNCRLWSSTLTHSFEAGWGCTSASSVDGLRGHTVVSKPWNIDWM